MDPHSQFPPSPREMYMYRPPQSGAPPQSNGHSGRSTSPSRGRPPPTLPERKPETQLGNRMSSSRSSMSSRGSVTSDISSPPPSPGYAQTEPTPYPHSAAVSSAPGKRYQENKPFSYAAGLGLPKLAQQHPITMEVSMRTREASPQNGRHAKSEALTAAADYARFSAGDDQVFQDQTNGPAIYQRINGSRDNRTCSTPEGLLGGRIEQVQEGSTNGKYSEGIYGKFVQPGSAGQHRPKLTYVPPPVVPTVQESKPSTEPNAQQLLVNQIQQQQIVQQYQYYQDYPQQTQHYPQQHPQQQSLQHTQQQSLQHTQQQSLQHSQQHTQPHLQQQTLQHSQQHTQQHPHQQIQNYPQQHPHQLPQQQPNVENSNEQYSPGAQQQNVPSYHYPKHQHHHHYLHQQQQGQGHHVCSSPASLSPAPSPKLAHASQKGRSRQDGIPPPPSFPVPLPPVVVHDRYTPSPPYATSHAPGRHSPSPPPPPPPLEVGAPSRSRSSSRRNNTPSPTPLVLHSNYYDTSHTHSAHPHSPQSSPLPQHPHLHTHNSHTGHQPMADHHHVVKAPPPHIPAPPPPPPPVEAPNPLSHPAGSAALRSPRTASPVRLSHQRQPSTATMDQLAQVKLRAVTEPSQQQTKPQPPGVEEATAAAINVRLKPTSGKWSNIYTEEEATLPPPPPPDELDELPPPPPPPELMGHDLAPGACPYPSHPPHLAAAAPLPPHPPRQPPLLAGEVNSCQPHHPPGRPAPNSAPMSNSSTQESSSTAKHTANGAAGNYTAENFNSGLERLIAEAVANMDFDIPDDIDLSQCPGLVEINKHTPNWKKDMIEKKNQEKIEEYVKNILKQREQEAKWKNVPEWKRKILQKKEEDESTDKAPTPDKEKKPTEQKSGEKEKKPGKKAPVPAPPPKDDFVPPKPKGDIVPAALSIDPEELAAMPPWKRELLFKRDKVPITFSNEFNPDEEDNSAPGNESPDAS